MRRAFVIGTPWQADGFVSISIGMGGSGFAMRKNAFQVSDRRGSSVIDRVIEALAEQARALVDAVGGALGSEPRLQPIPVRVRSKRR